MVGYDCYFRFLYEYLNIYLSLLRVGSFIKWDKDFILILVKSIGLILSWKKFVLLDC